MTPELPPELDTAVRRLLDLPGWALFDVAADGRILAGHDGSGTLQLVELGPDGTQTMITDLGSRCSGRYLPDGRGVVVQHDSGGDERMQLSLAPLGAEVSAIPYTLDTLQPLVHDPAFMHVLLDVTADTLVYSTNRRNSVDMDVVVRDLASGEETVLYDGGGYIADAAVAHDRSAVAITALSLRPASTMITLAGGRSGPVTDPDELAHHAQVAWTADDTALIMSSSHDREFAAVLQVSLDGGTWTELVAADDHELRVSVAPDGRSMVVAHHRDGADTLAIHEADGTLRAAVDLPAGVPSVVWAPDGSRFAVLLGSPTDPGSLHLVDARTGQAELIVDGTTVLAGLTLSVPDVRRFPTQDGEQVPCFVYPAVGATPSLQGDLGLQGASVLHVHGGPEGEAPQVFNPVVQCLAAVGFTVLVPNVRGSAGYGKRWVGLDDGPKRLDSVADLAALHAALPGLGLDPQRSALWGGSYGGYMVLAGVTMQPELWAAGVDIVGISSLVTFLENTSAYRRAYREREYGRLATDRDMLIEASPLTYLDQLRAPLFIIHGANDPRVPLSEAEQIDAALTARGIRHALRVYGDEGHGLSQRANRLDAYPAAIAFLADVLG